MRRSALALPAALMAAGAALLAPAAEARVQKVHIGSNFFAPGKKTVRTGDRVRFVWAGRYSLYCSQHQEMTMRLTVKRR